MAKEQVIEITKEGLEEKKNRLEYLITVERPRNIESLKDARAQGDLSENADYDAAREEQKRIESEIAELENIIRNAKVIEISRTGNISMGKRVEVRFQDGFELKFQLVGTTEANPLADDPKISNMSPLGKAILDKQKGDTVRFRTEKGTYVNVEILDVQ